MAASDLSDLQPKVGPAAHNERRDGWCGGVHFLIYPIHLNFKLPRGFHKRLALKLLVLTTKIPVACVGVLAISGHWPFGSQRITFKIPLNMGMGLLGSQRSFTQSGSSGPHRAKGWMVRRGTLPNLP